MSILAMIRQALDVLSLLPQGGPSCANIAVTNVCNANCDFCGYARDKLPREDQTWVDADRLIGPGKGIDILHARGIRYLTFTGGEPTLHPRLANLVAYATSKGMRAAVVTNGYTLLHRELIDRLAAAGLRTMFISIDSPDALAHEKNRGLPGVWERVREANGELARRGIKTVASVTINKLIASFDDLFVALKGLGFETVTFTYPKRELNSTSRVYSGVSALIDYEVDDLAGALEAVKARKGAFGILNPAASIAEIIRFLRGQEQIFPCYGGYKYFWVDWNLNVFRCDFWEVPMGKLEDFATTPFIRDNCTKCISVCYRDSSVYFNFPVALGDAMRLIGRGQLIKAFATVFGRSSRASVAALLAERKTLRRLARTP